MSSRSGSPRRSASITSVLVLVALTAHAGDAQQPPKSQEPAARATPADPATLLLGKHVYQRYCLSCHGERGDGRGESAQFLDPRPRDFTAGVYKWRSTPSGTLPLDSDLFRTIRNGLYNTNMPAWTGLSDDQVWDVIAYVESFSPSFSREPRGKPIEIPPEPPASPESIRAGKELYQTAGCFNCHGNSGRGDGQSAQTLTDDWGRPIRPPDFTTKHLKCGSESRDIYRILMTGLNGTPMPSYGESLTPEQAWNLAHYVRTLMDAM